MKIGIITFSRCDNYGAELQAYALQKKLNGMGYDAEVLDLEMQKKELASSRVIKKAILNRYKQFGLWKGTGKVFRLMADKYALRQSIKRNQDKIAEKHKLFTSFFNDFTRHSDRHYSLSDVYTVDMPIGGYTDFYISSPPCGLLTEDTFVGRDDNIGSFYCAERFRAQLLWFRQGYVEYKFPKEIVYRKLESIEFAFEACAEAPGYRMEYPSDITVWINGKEIGTWVYPGDYGGRRGICTPEWWTLDSTQFGDYKRWKVTGEGSFVEDVMVSGVRLSDLSVEKQDFIRFRLGIKEDARHIGGINLFGEKFGDYPRNLTMTIRYQK